MTQQSHQLNEEALHLLKEQVHKIKLLANDNQLKQHQILLLKDTIKSLEEERDTLLQQTNHLKNNMRTLIEDVSFRNSRYEQVLAQLQSDNHSLKQSVDYSNDQIAKIQEEAGTLARALRETQHQKESLIREAKELSDKLKAANSTSVTRATQLDTCKKQVILLRENNRKLMDQLEQTSNQLNFSAKQLNLVKQKYEESLSEAEVKLKEAHVDRSKFKALQFAQKDLESAIQDNKKIKAQLERTIKVAFSKQRQCLILREQNLELQEKEAREWDLVKQDIRNFCDIMHFKHRVTEYYSVFRDQLENVEAFIVAILKQKDSMETALTNAEQQIASLQRELMRKQDEIQEARQACFDAKASSDTEFKELQVRYQEKIHVIAIKLRKQEHEIVKLQSRDKQMAHFQTELQRLKAETSGTLEKKDLELQKLRTENAEVNAHLAKIIPLCEESVLAKNKFNLLKYVTCQIIRHFFFIANKIREMGSQTGLLKQFCIYFDRVHFQFGAGSRKGSRLKARVNVVIAIIRLRNCAYRYQNSSSKQGFSHLVVIKDRLLRRILRQSMSSDENLVTSEELENFTNLFNKNWRAVREESDLVELIMMNYQERHNWREVKSRPLSLMKLVKGDLGRIQQLNNMLRQSSRN